MIAGSMSVNATKHFWEPLRASLVKGLLGYVPIVSNRGVVLSHEEDNGPPLVTYVSRQGGGRRLGQEYHDSLVSSLRELENEGVIRFHVARMELMTIHEQIELAAKTTIMIGVHGNGLTVSFSFSCSVQQLIAIPAPALDAIITMVYRHGDLPTARYVPLDQASH